ncbi:hypothetical protein GCM10023340_21790 [Nocardioides marinquilinus]|uniref:Bacterial Ig-like domain-containing protein n=1 Tax=Nocardioides marinquilinus TaxID=1210400 RepID=A0ABP9PKK6_9ACTN
MTHRTRRGAAALTALTTAAAGLAVGLAVAAAPQASAADPVAVTGATFAWDLNDEATSGAFAPGTWNLMSAGRIGDPGAGGQTLRSADDGATWSNGEAAGWSATSGDVTVEDLRSDGSWATATFAGTRTDAAGVPANVGGVRGETRLSFGGGTGTVDADAGTATLSWDGDATLLAYSGMTFFYLSDPELTVADGAGTVTATVGGYATSQADPDAWEALPEVEVTVATFSGVTVGPGGFTATPDYAGVTYDGPSGSTAQVRTGATWGAFPTDFVDVQQDLGQGPYWYSTGSSADVRKPANPFTVTYATVPTVRASRTDFLPDGTFEVTVEGSGFDPAAATGARPPLAGRPAGAYVVFGKFAPTWRPSEGATGATRKNTSQKWAVLAEDMASIGGPDGGAVELRPDGSFTAVLTVDRAAIDAAATDPALTQYGIYTYAGSGAVSAGYETYTPVTFTRATPQLTVTAPAVRFGRPATATVLVAGEGGSDGSVTLRRAGTAVGTADLVDGRATFRLEGLRAGDHTLNAVYSGSTTSLGGSRTATLTVARAITTTRLQVVRRPTRTKAGAVAVTVSSPTTAPAGRVTVAVSRGTTTVRTTTPVLRGGTVRAVLPRGPRGRCTVRVTYAGTRDVAGSRRSTTYFVK